MGTIKTKPGDETVEQLLERIEPATKKEDCEALAEIFKAETGESPIIWGGSMIGYGSYHYKSKSGQEGDWFKTGFAARKANISLYIIFRKDGHEEELKALGKFKSGVGCIYIKRLSDIDETVLRKLIRDGYELAGKTMGSN